MFNLVDSAIKLIVFIPILIVLAYFFGALCHSFFGGPIWLWITGITIFGLFAAIPELNKSKEKQSSTD